MGAPHTDHINILHIEPILYSQHPDQQWFKFLQE